MKLVTAIIKPDKVEALRQALTGVDIHEYPHRLVPVSKLQLYRA